MDRASIGKIKMLITDVDGVLTDGRIWLDTDGEWKRMFSVIDGVGLKRVIESGYQVGVITGAKSKDVQTRVKFLGIQHFYEGVKDKIPCYEEILSQTGLKDENIAYIGDDFFDIPILKRCGFPASVPTGLEDVRVSANYVTESLAGFGAVREVCELLIKFGYYSLK
ncbi:MAG: HAD-IIIA family hydrolase [Bdellovibrionales bacterium]|nr:HAD-IIIA family hydrolase [Bdellovibrionales bacterium]